MIALALVAAVAIALLWPRGGGSSSSRTGAASGEVTRERGAEETAHDSTAAAEARRDPRRATSARAAHGKLSPVRREALSRALAHARELRLARGAQAGPPAGSPQPDDAPAAQPLSLENKTGSNEEWEERQLQTLNQLLGECYDLGRAEDPTLEGKVGLRFTISGEPDVGGLVDDVSFDPEYTTIEQQTLLECMRESVYALELDPPPAGVHAAREVTLKLHPD